MGWNTRGPNGDGTHPGDYSAEEVRRAIEDVTRPKLAVAPALVLAEADPEDDEPEKLPLTADILPEPARSWAQACSRWLALDETMPTIAAICAAATVLQGRVRVRWKAGVEEPVCLYWLVFSATGTLKSQVLSRATQAIRQLEAERRDSAEREERRRKGERKWREAQLSRLRRQKAPQSRLEADDWREDMARLEHEIDQLEPSIAPQWLHGDVNPSLLPKILSHNHEAEGLARASFMVDEGTFLSNVCGRHQGSTQVETLLSAINGAPLSFVRASKATDGMVNISLPATYMTICAFVQPDYYDQLTSDQKLADSGFLGRTIRTVLDSKASKPGWDSPQIPDHIQKAYDAWLRRLATENVPSLVDLLSDATTGPLVRALYDRIEWDGTGYSRRVLGLICRIVAIIHVGSENCGQRTRAVDGDRPQLDATEDSETAEERYAREERNAIVGTVDTPGGVTDGTGGATRITRIVEKLFSYIYLQSLREVRETELPADPMRSLVRSVWDRLPSLPPVPQSTGSTVAKNRTPIEQRLKSVRSIGQTWSGKTRPSQDRIYMALEELETMGAIAWVPESARRNKGVVRYREFLLLMNPPRRLRPVE